MTGAQHSSTDEHDGDLVALLTAARPPAPVADAATDAELDAMVLTARRDGAPVRRRRVAAVAAATMIGLGGAGAAAATHDMWAPWAREPDAAIVFTLPSGAVCEERIGDIQGTHPQIVEAVRDYVASTDVLALADVDGWLELLDDGGERSEDRTYSDAVRGAVNDVIFAELDRQGLTEGDQVVQFTGQAHCPGAQW